jgi:hypothetical protein
VDLVLALNRLHHLVPRSRELARRPGAPFCSISQWHRVLWHVEGRERE